MAEVQHQCRGKDVAEPILNRYPEDDPGARASAEAVGKQVRRERREDVLHGAVLVDVAGNAERREIAHFVGVGDGAAENQNRQPPFVQRPERPDKLDAGRGRQVQVEHDEIDGRHVIANPREQLRPALHRHRVVAGAFERGAEAVADKRGVVSDDDGLRRRRRAAAI